jgi:GAF domain-containing protein
VAAEVARDATTAQNLGELLNSAANLILNRFSFYHTGIYLLDPQREYAVLHASPTEAGRAMLASNHRFRVGQVGIVGYVAAKGEPRIVLDTARDSAYFDNPLLPKTRSEVALPLKVNQQTIGVLDVQSDRPEAFTQDDIATLQIMADQLALAIERVQLVENLKQNFQELQIVNQRFTQETWQSFSHESDFRPGYKFDGIKVTSLEDFPVESREVLRKGRAIVLPGKEEGVTVAAPLKLREQVIGVISVRFVTETVAPDVIGLVEETASRLAIALENARLYVETQKLAQRERAISEVSSKITSSFNIETILRTTVMEIGKMLPDAEIVVQFDKNKE